MLRLEHVSYRYRDAPAPALHDVSLNIRTGGVFGLLGPNGAGKTTLISLLAGLLSTTEGRLTLDGEALDQRRARQASAIALVPQDYAFYPMLTVAENLRFFAGVLGLSAAAQNRQIDSAIAFARLEQVVRQTAGALSGGLRRRLNLAIGLLGTPSLLLLDEPTVGVDPQSRHFLLDSIAALPGQGTTVIYTSHYMEEVEAICQDIAIIDQGTVLAAGTLDDLLRTSAPALDICFDRTPPATLLTRHGATSADGRHYRFPLATEDTLPALLAELSSADCKIRQLNTGQQNLEQVFMNLTRRSLRD